MWWTCIVQRQRQLLLIFGSQWDSRGIDEAFLSIQVCVGKEGRVSKLQEGSD
jgi:hypothetical protein